MTDIVDRNRVFGERPQAVERIAPGYFEQHFVAEHMARYKWAARWVGGRRVLDAACGTGYGGTVLRAAGARNILSLDVSRDALRFGSKRYGITPVCADALGLPFAAATFEVVVSLETIEHLEDPVRFVKEIRRVLRPGGEVLLSTPNAARSSGLNPYHLHEMTLDQLRDLLDKTGFRLQGIWGQQWGLPAGVWHKIRGVRRVLHEIERIPAVTSWIGAGLKPRYLCLRAVTVKREHYEAK